MIFHCKGYISISGRGSGVLYSLFWRGSENIPYFQVLDRDLIIRDFIPFPDEEQFMFIRSELELKRDINEPCLLSFRDADGFLREGAIHQLQSLFEDGVVVFDRLPILTRMQLARVFQRNLSEKITLWDEFAQSFIKSKESRQIFKRTEIAIHKTESKIWTDINNDEDYDYNLFSSLSMLSKMDGEGIFVWLIRNNGSHLWPFAWLEYNKKTRMVQEIFDLGVNYILKRNDSVRSCDNVEKEILSILIGFRNRLQDKKTSMRFL